MANMVKHMTTKVLTLIFAGFALTTMYLLARVDILTARQNLIMDVSSVCDGTLTKSKVRELLKSYGYDVVKASEDPETDLVRVESVLDGWTTRRTHGVITYRNRVAVLWQISTGISAL